MQNSSLKALRNGRRQPDTGRGVKKGGAAVSVAGESWVSAAVTAGRAKQLALGWETLLSSWQKPQEGAQAREPDPKKKAKKGVPYPRQRLKLGP